GGVRGIADRLLAAELEAERLRERLVEDVAARAGVEQEGERTLAVDLRLDDRDRARLRDLEGDLRSGRREDRLARLGRGSLLATSGLLPGVLGSEGGGEERRGGEKSIQRDHARAPVTKGLGLFGGRSQGSVFRTRKQESTRNRDASSRMARKA